MKLTLLIQKGSTIGFATIMFLFTGRGSCWKLMLSAFFPLCQMRSSYRAPSSSLIVFVDRHLHFGKKLTPYVHVLNLCRIAPDERKHSFWVVFGFFFTSVPLWGVYWSSSKIQICCPPCPWKNYSFLIFSGFNFIAYYFDLLTVTTSEEITVSLS